MRDETWLASMRRSEAWKSPVPVARTPTNDGGDRVCPAAATAAAAAWMFCSRFRPTHQALPVMEDASSNFEVGVRPTCVRTLCLDVSACLPLPKRIKSSAIAEMSAQCCITLIPLRHSFAIIAKNIAISHTVSKTRFLGLHFCPEVMGQTSTTVR